MIFFPFVRTFQKVCPDFS